MVLMDSLTLKKYGFLKWISLTELKKSQVPFKPGVYVFRARQPFGRLCEFSDIVYVGYTQDLNQRLIYNYIEGNGGETTQRIHSYLFEKDYIRLLEISWVLSDDSKKMESGIRLEYESEHHELPPWNRQR